MLVDAASLYFRAFYGVPRSMLAPDGTPINAVRGFTDMMSTLISRFRPTEFAACLDEDWRPAWRVALVPSYKTHRLAEPANSSTLEGGAGPGEAEPEELAVQVPIILETLAAFGLSTYGVAQHEADDVIGSLATQAAGPVDVVTGDRDLLQLIDDERKVRVLYTGKGVAAIEIITDSEVRERYGVSAAQYADFATLRGDSSDGLPGVPGVGPKSAAALLAQFGSLAGVLTALDSHDPSLKKMSTKLTNARDYLLAADQVVNVVRDLPHPRTPLTLPRTPADPNKVTELAVQWGLATPFTRLTKTLAGT